MHGRKAVFHCLPHGKLAQQHNEFSILIAE
jgi:hypothetical protein